MSDNEGDFTLGPFGEILPPPLVDGLTAEEAWELAGLASLPSAASVERVPPPGLSEDERGGLAAMAPLQQKRLAEALGGQLPTPDGRALYQAVTRRGRPLSLRPLGMEQESYRSFAPVLQRTARDRWRFGVEGYGRTQELPTGNPAQALEQARQLYVQWEREENGGDM